MDYENIRKVLTALPYMRKEKGEKHCYEIVETILRAYTKERLILTPEEDELQKRQFQDLLHPVTHQSEFCRYMYEKPRGYAGDYITQEMIWLGRTQADNYRYRGTTETGEIINSITFDMANCCANELRIYRLKQILLESGEKIASIGCGSCIEFWNICEASARPKDILLVDQDGAALERAKEQLGQVPRHCSIVYNRENVLKFTLKNSGTWLGSRDLIYAFGLLDYFPPKSAKRILKAMWKLVAPGGLLVFTNAHPCNPTRLWMEYVGEWYLDYKDKNTCLSLVSELDDVDEIDYEIDDFGVYQYVKALRCA